jgi:hypothetical protein
VPAVGDGGKLRSTAHDEIDAYLAVLDEPKRSTLEALRKAILAAVADAEQCLSYGMPAFNRWRNDEHGHEDGHAVSCAARC